MRPAQEALERLRQGNLRFVSGARPPDFRTDRKRPADLVTGQRPFAIVLGCSDSRVPVEIVFDQDLGDLFVVRLAGNVVTSEGLGSIELAAAKFGTRLIVVLGHTLCGAIKVTVEEHLRPTGSLSPSLRSIFDRISPLVEPLLRTDLRHDPGALVGRAVRENIDASVDLLRRGSEVLEGLVRTDGLLVVGAEYSLETGIVEFLGDASR